LSEALYNKIAKYYDDVLGNADSSVKFIKDHIKKFNPGAVDILELGCGTGIYLNSLSADYNVTGIDISNEMLKIARGKIPDGEFLKMKIEDFELKKKFDVILCLYDTINHLVNFNLWKKTFKKVYAHLNSNGIFIFDMNTLNKFQSLEKISPVINNFKKNYLIITVKKISVNVYNWNLKVFEHVSGSDYKLAEADIPETSFEIDKVQTELSKNFRILKIFNTEKSRLNNSADRVFFICKKI
jgi:2-polyprenyl-3-methyl-5-hydroxy-6-metoxy-1,4-benzoquinol methylase